MRFIHLLSIVLLHLLPITTAQDVNTLINELPPCVIPCYRYAIGSLCSSPNDWKCGCTQGSFQSGWQAAQSAPCQTAVYTCTTLELETAENLVYQICIDEASGTGTTTSSGSKPSGSSQSGGSQTSSSQSSSSQGSVKVSSASAAIWTGWWPWLWEAVILGLAVGE